MSIAITACQVAVNIAFDRFAQHVVWPTYNKNGKGLYEFPVKEYVISVNIDEGFPDNVGLKILFGNKLEVASGHINFNGSFKATVTEHTTVHHLPALADHLTGMLDRGEFDEASPSVGVTEVMYQATFKDLLQKFNRLIVVPAYKQLPSGEYQWPIGEYTLAVILPESPKTTVIPFTIFINKSTTLSRGYFDTGSFEVTELICPPLGHAETILFPLSELVKTNDTEEMSPAWEASQVEEPPMVLITNNTPDISDEWVTWFCKRNPGTSYAKAIHAALTHLSTEARKLKAIVDKYSINRY